MTDTAGGWLDERLDGDGRWTSTDAGFDIEAEARAVLERIESMPDDDAPAVIGGAGSWLAGHRVAEPVEPVDEIVLASDEIEAAIASVDGIAVVDGAPPWSPDDFDHGVDADAAVADVEAGGVVDPFDVFLATTPDDSANPDPLGPEAGTAASETDAGAGTDADDLGPAVDDIAPAAEPGAEADTAADEASAGAASTGTGGVRDEHATDSGPDAAGTTEPIGATSSRLDAFDLPDAVDTGSGLRPDPAVDDDRTDDLDDLLDGDIS